MRLRIWRNVLTAIAFAALVAQTTSAAIVFRDDFSDGNAGDGMPATWVASDGTNMEVVDGSIVLAVTRGSDAVASGLGAAGVPDVELFDTSIRTQFRMLSVGSMGIFARATSFGAFATLSRLFSDGRVGFALSSPVQTDFDPLNEDLIMQLDTIGATANLWLWRAGESMPAAPIATTNTSRVPGFAGLAVVADPGTTAEVAFRYVTVADLPIPEPSSALLVVMGAMCASLYGRTRR